MRLLLPALRSDYTAAETYRYVPGVELGCQIVALVGRDDPQVAIEEALAWGEHTSGPFHLETFVGAHFYLVGGEREVAELVSTRLAQPRSAT